MNTEDLAKRLLGLIAASGADEGEVYIEHTSGLEVVVRDQAIERLRNKESVGYALRLIHDHRMAFVHSSDLREPSLEKAVGKGLDLAKTATADEANCLAEASPAMAKVTAYDEAAQGIPLERKVGLLRDIETMAFAYDPLIAKLIVWGEDRQKAIAKMRRALDDYGITGIKNNLPFLREAFASEIFKSGNYDTHFILKLKEGENG